MTDPDAQRATIQQLFTTAINIRQHEITSGVYEAAKGVVQGGPFRGMRLLRKSSWGAGEISPKLLGCYEAELHPHMAEVIATSFPLVINVGCAEGYYAVGLARRMPACRVIAYDVSEAAQDVCREAAAANGVAGRLEVRGLCTPQTLVEDLAGNESAFLLVDCEGGELGLLDPALAPGLARCNILVECHDFLNRMITPSLLSRFAATHTVERIDEGARNPNHPMLHRTPSLDRWLAVCEFRPERMHWLMFRAKQQN